MQFYNKTHKDKAVQTDLSDIVGTDLTILNDITSYQSKIWPQHKKIFLETFD